MNARIADSLLRGLLVAAGLAFGFSLIFFFRSLVFGNERSTLSILLWQSAVWAPWLIFLPVISGLVSGRFGRVANHAQTAAFQMFLAFLLVLIHAPWFVWISAEISPYLDLEGTRFGVFQFFFIFWAAIDLFLFWAVLAHTRSGEQSHHIAELELRIASVSTNRSGEGDDVLRLDQLAVRKGAANIFLTAEDIDWIEAEDYCARLHVGEASHLVRMSLSKLENSLDPAKFVRIHRSTIVNLDRLEGMERIKSGDHEILLTGGVKRRVSRSGLAALRQRVSMIS